MKNREWVNTFKKEYFSIFFWEKRKILFIDETFICNKIYLYWTFMFWWWVLAELKTSKYIYIFYLVKTYINKHLCIRSWQRHHPVLRAQGWTLMRKRTVSIRQKKKRKTGTTGTTLALHLGKSRGRTENFWQTTMWTGNFPVTVVILLQAEIYEYPEI